MWFSDSKLYRNQRKLYKLSQVCAPSCHDCSTMRAWWEEDEERRRRFFKTVVGSNKLPPSKCVPEIAYFIIRQHVEAPSMWAIFPLQVHTFLVLCSNILVAMSRHIDWLEKHVVLWLFRTCWPWRMSTQRALQLKRQSMIPQIRNIIGDSVCLISHFFSSFLPSYGVCKS